MITSPIDSLFDEVEIGGWVSLFSNIISSFESKAKTAAMTIKTGIKPSFLYP